MEIMTFDKIPPKSKKVDNVQIAVCFLNSISPLTIQQHIFPQRLSTLFTDLKKTKKQTKQAKNPHPTKKPTKILYN